MVHKLIPKLNVNADVSQKALKSFVASTELANLLVRKYNVPFRSAHKIVGALVKRLIEAKLTFADASPQMLHKAAEESTGIKVTVQNEDLAALEDPVKLVEACNVKGGPAPDEVKRALCEREKKVLCTKSNISKLDKELEDAENKLETVVQQFIPKSSENGTFKNNT
jgi:argininosuccinate lyase